MRPRIHSSLSFLVLAAGFLMLDTAFGMQSFLDVPVGHRAFNAFEDLSARGILQGYDDGTVKPEKLVNRAEAAKIIVKPVTFDVQLKENFTQDYDDVSSAVWYFPYVARAFHILKIIDGPPKTTVFHGERTVIRAELLKMILLANNADITLDSDIRTSLAIDVSNPNEWFYPYMRFALSAGMITPEDDGLLHPEKELTREDTALLLYNFYRYREKKGNQELVSRAENAIFYVLNALAEDDLDSAEISATQALLSARGTLRSSIPNLVTESTLQISEGFYALVQAERAFSEERWEDVISAATKTIRHAKEAKRIRPEMAPLAAEMERIAAILGGTSE